MFLNKRYEKLKFDSRNVSFQFKKEYNKMLSELREKNNPVDVSRFFPNEKKARSTINNIRAKYVTKETKVKVKKTKDLNSRFNVLIPRY